MKSIAQRLRPQRIAPDTDGRLHVLPRVFGLPYAAPAQCGRLLRLLFVRLRPTDTPPSSAAGQIADSGGVLGAIFAALCCADTSFIITALATVGLGFLKNDVILWPLMFASLAVALWSFWIGRRLHGLTGPRVVAVVGAIALVAGIVVIHGLSRDSSDLDGCGGPHRCDDLERHRALTVRSACALTGWLTVSVGLV